MVIIEAQDEPVVSFAGLNPAAKYIVVCLDLDAPHPSFPVLGPILHWAQPGLQAASSAEDAHVKDGLKPSQPFIANYAGPGPPPGSPPHRYCFFLYEQPESFDIKAHAPANGAQMGILPRMRYSLDKWGKAAQLGPIVAANYFVSN